MTTMKLNANGTIHEVETKPITLVCHPDNVNVKIEDPDVLEITPQDTVMAADCLSQEAWDAIRIMHPFPTYWKMIFGENEIPLVLKGEGLGYRHVVGLILLVHKAISLNKTPFVRLPESYLHPRAQLGLADFFITVQKGS